MSEYWRVRAETAEAELLDVKHRLTQAAERLAAAEGKFTAGGADIHRLCELFKHFVDELPITRADKQALIGIIGAIEQ